MRPRLIAVDDAGYRAVRNPRADASMRPRLIAVDDAVNSARVSATIFGFNEATADRRG